MAPGSNRLPHPSVALEIELLDKSTQVEILLLSKFGRKVFCGKKKFKKAQDYAFTDFRGAESSWLLKPHPVWFGKSALLWINHTEEGNLQEDIL